MKLVLSVILSFILGLGSMYLLLGRTFSVISQMSSEMQLDTRIKYLELLEQNKIEPFKELLKTSIDCESAIYEKNLNNLFWEKTSFSKKILEKSKAYIKVGSECDKIRTENI